MEPMILQYPVHTLDHTVLLPAGTPLTDDKLREVAAAGASVPMETADLLGYGTTRSDLERFMGQLPYQAIFSDPELVSDVMGLMERVRLSVPFLESLTYFSHYDFYTYRHVLMVFALSAMLAKDLLQDHGGLMSDMATGPTHDFGKICVPIPLLRKNTPLTPSERSLLRHHTVAGYVLLCHCHRDPDDMAARVARDHHERKDGSGHPRGIRLEDFLVEIIAASDVFDALVSPRPYRPQSYDNRTALEEITAMAERNELGWDVVKALVARHRRQKGDFSQTVVSLQKRGRPPARNYYGVTAEDDTPASAS